MCGARWDSLGYSLFIRKLKGNFHVKKLFLCFYLIALKKLWISKKNQVNCSTRSWDNQVFVLPLWHHTGQTPHFVAQCTGHYLENQVLCWVTIKMVGTLGHSNDTFMYFNVFIRHIVTPEGVKTGRIASMPQNKKKAHQNIKTFFHMQFPFKTFKS